MTPPRALVRSAVSSLALAAFAACGGGGAGPENQPDPALADGGSLGPTSSADGAPGADASDAPSFQDAGDAGFDAPLDAVLSADADVDAGDAAPSVRFVGRFDTNDPTGPRVGWPGARIVARFDGTTVSATMKDTSIQGEQGRWDVIVDGLVQASPLVMSEGQATYPLATGLAPGVHTIELWRRTEALVSTTQFLAYDFGAGTLLAPPPAPARRLEFLLDSGGNGYGIEGNGPGCAFSAATENEHKAYPGLIAHDLGADHHDLGYQGRGVYWNYLRATDLDTFDVVYPRTMPLSSTPAWNFPDFVPDVVWITLGGNDWDQPNPGDPPPPLAAFQNKYAQLVATVRQKHPSAHIFCAVPTSLNDGYPVGYNAFTNMQTALTSVVSTANTAGDAKVYYYEFTRADHAADLTGCEYHPNVAKHRSMADEAILIIKQKTGWL